MKGKSVLLNLKFPKENKGAIIESIQAYFWEEHAEEMGSLAAEQLLEFMVKEIGPYIYNLAIKDAREMIGDRMLVLEDELYSLEKPTGSRI